MALTLDKQERMVSRRLIETLFQSGVSRRLSSFPLRVVYQQRQRPEGASGVQLLVSVPKRRFKHAVDRNRVKRQLREAFRRHKSLLTDALAEDKQLLIAFLWVSDSHQPTVEVEHRVVGLLRRVASSLTQPAP